MTEKSIQLIQISVTEFRELIIDCVAAELQKANKIIQLNPEPEKDKLMSREETAALLRVSYTTLFHWNNDKTLPNQKIGGRVYYQRSVIMAKLNQVV